MYMLKIWMYSDHVHFLITPRQRTSGLSYLGSLIELNVNPNQRYRLRQRCCTTTTHSCMQRYGIYVRRRRTTDAPRAAVIDSQKVWEYRRSGKLGVDQIRCDGRLQHHRRKPDGESSGQSVGAWSTVLPVTVQTRRALGDTERDRVRWWK